MSHGIAPDFSRSWIDPCHKMVKSTHLFRCQAQAYGEFDVFVVCLTQGDKVDKVSIKIFSVLSL